MTSDNLTCEETMAILRIKDRRTLLRMMANHEIGYYEPVGNRYLFSRSKHIEPFLAKIERKAAVCTN